MKGIMGASSEFGIAITVLSQSPISFGRRSSHNSTLQNSWALKSCFIHNKHWTSHRTLFGRPLAMGESSFRFPGRRIAGLDPVRNGIPGYRGDRRMDYNEMAAKMRKMRSAAEPQPKELNHGFHGFHG
jgi:hypothetical protein